METCSSVRPADSPDEARISYHLGTYPLPSLQPRYTCGYSGDSFIEEFHLGEPKAIIYLFHVHRPGSELRTVNGGC